MYYALVYVSASHKEFYLPKCVSAVCFYSTIDYYIPQLTKMEDIKSHLMNGLPVPDNMYRICSHIRAPEYDSDISIRNRFAYTSIHLVRVYPKTKQAIWRYMSCSIDILRYLKNNHNLQPELLEWIEKCIWLNPFVRYKARHICRQIMPHILINISEKIYDPDYIWRTGDRNGQTTLEIFHKKFLEHIKL